MGLLEFQMGKNRVGEGAYRKHSGKLGKGRNLCGWKQVMSLYFSG